VAANREGSASYLSVRRNRCDPDWLAARVAADDAARATTVTTLLPELRTYLIEAAGPGGTVQIIDLGAGTGANQRWLAPQLPIRQRWLHLDHNPVISRSLPLPAETEIVDESVEALGQLLTRASGDRQLVTCSALLDVLTTEQVEAVCRAVIDNRVPAFFSLTVTGGLRLSPNDPHDRLLLTAFNDHQRRAGGAGPEATTLTVSLLRAAEFAVTTQETPWRLTGERPRLLIKCSGGWPRPLPDPALTRTATAWLG
jgi:hypothetical protein